MTASLSTLYERYSSRFNSNGAVLERKPVFRNEETWVVAHDQLHPLLKALRDESGFDFLIDISSVDNMEDSVKLAETEGVVCAKQTSGAELGCEASVHPHGSGRFELVYELCRLSDSALLRVKTYLTEKECRVRTVSNLWPTANWHEREIYDMMGILFEGHPDLRRILMWDGYPYFPLRKDFPLEGRPSQMPDIAFSEIAPLEGGPFVTSPADLTTQREPRAHPAEPLK